jgi:putative transposase
MSDLQSDADGAGKDPLAAVKALTGPYLRMGMPGEVRTRIKSSSGDDTTCFHLMSRLCEGVAFWDDTEKEALVLLMRKMARFCGMKVLTHCVMGNHFHVLVRVPNQAEWVKQFEGPEGEARLMKHLRTLYSRRFVASLRVGLARWRKAGNEPFAERCLNALKARFCDISVYAKEVKTRFTKWYNKRHGRKGTLWMGKFHSVVVDSRFKKRDLESGVDALKVMAAYIDLNPVRSELVERAQEYRWSGWSAALAGDKEAIAGLCDLMQCSEEEWEKGAREVYGGWVSERRSVVKERRDATVEWSAHDQDTNEVIRLTERIRAFSGGLAVGSEGFVEEVFNERRDLFGPKRKRGARRVVKSKGPLREMLCALRDLRGK